MNRQATGIIAALIVVLSGCFAIEEDQSNTVDQAQQELNSVASIHDSATKPLTKGGLSEVKPGKVCINGTTDVATAYNKAETVLAVRLQTALLRSPKGAVRYRAKVLETFKGCAELGSDLTLQFRAGSAQAARLETGSEYLVNGHRIRAGGVLSLAKSGSTGTIIAVNPCDLFASLGDLTEADNAFLSSRYNCCGDECACVDGSSPYSCLVNPCENSACSLEGASCQANYCGGCKAEWTDGGGAAVCETQCTVDTDCGKGSWCRDDQDGRGQCVAYSGAGGSCEGYMPPWMRNECAPALQCVPIEPTFDLGGVCASCNYNGTPYQAGDSFPASDGCNTCSCKAGGSVICTLIGCPEPEEDSCVTGGCSNEACIPESQGGINTLCVWKPEYDCLQYSSCGNFGSANSCGWEQTTEYLECLEALANKE